MGEIGNVEQLPLHNLPSTASGPELSLQVINVAASSMREMQIAATSTSMGVYDSSDSSGYLSEINPQEAWLPITESRNGSTVTCVFHLLSSGIGIQALLLPVAFSTLGWAWGIICLSLAFTWQLYTIWVLVQLHESVPGIGTRYSRYLQLAIAAFGPKLGKLLAIFPVMYLSGGSCVLLIIRGAGTMELFFKMMLGGEATSEDNPLAGAGWFLVFTCMAIALAQRPNLNSIAGFSLIGAVTAIAYCTLIWALPISKGRPTGVSYNSQKEESGMSEMFDVLNAIGMIALAFRGHNLVLEIQGTLPSSSKCPSKKQMWRGVTLSYIIIAMCLFPVAIAGFWAYGNKIPSNGGMLTAFMQFHGHDTSKFAKGLVYLLVVINCLSSFQIYAMPVFDNLEFRYTCMKNKRCSWWVRTGFRLFFGALAFFIAVAFPFLPSLAALIGGIALPLTLAYPCFMWISIKKPRQKGHGVMWCLNLGLGCLGMVLSVLLVVAAVWNLATKGLHANFFHPE
ncbi:lysine histidine transporter-like 8 [Populus alba x Populus x berolinensis]|nr:lysine histidine transporter-like 8 [Populus alba x Populus x berolinensis]